MSGYDSSRSLPSIASFSSSQDSIIPESVQEGFTNINCAQQVAVLYLGAEACLAENPLQPEPSLAMPPDVPYGDPDIGRAVPDNHLTKPNMGRMVEMLFPCVNIINGPTGKTFQHFLFDNVFEWPAIPHVFCHDELPTRPEYPVRLLEESFLIS